MFHMNFVQITEVNLLPGRRHKWLFYVKYSKITETMRGMNLILSIHDNMSLLNLYVNHFCFVFQSDKKNFACYVSLKYLKDYID